MHNLFTLFWLLLAIPTLAQIDTLPPADSLFQSLKNYHQNLLQAQLTEFKISEKGAWLKYIPSIGIGYNLGTDPEGNLQNVLRPSLNYNTNVIYRVRQDKEARQAKMKSIKQTAQLASQNEQRKLELLLRKYQNEVTELEFMEQLNEIDTELYEIATVQFAATEIAPSTYLSQKRDYLQKQFEIFQQQKLIRSLAAEIRQKSMLNNY